MHDAAPHRASRAQQATDETKLILAQARVLLSDLIAQHTIRALSGALGLATCRLPGSQSRDMLCLGVLSACG